MTTGKGLFLTAGILAGVLGVSAAAEAMPAMGAAVVQPPVAAPSLEKTYYCGYYGCRRHYRRHYYYRPTYRYYRPHYYRPYSYYHPYYYGPHIGVGIGGVGIY